MKRRILTLGLTAIMAVGILTGCGGEKAQEPTVVSQKEVSASESAQVDFKAEVPVIVTSFGQSADAAMLKAIMGKTGVEFTYNNLVKAEDLSGIKTMIVAVGASSKGLGAAGIKPEEELARAQKVVDKAKDSGAKIIVAHLGGESRRGKLSDEFIDIGLNGADYLIVVEAGNKDGKFTNFAKDNNIPLSLVSSIAKTTDPLTNAFK